MVGPGRAGGELETECVKGVGCLSRKSSFWVSYDEERNGGWCSLNYKIAQKEIKCKRTKLNISY